jgi:long-chain acyl-CoA synthetase
VSSRSVKDLAPPPGGLEEDQAPAGSAPVVDMLTAAADAAPGQAAVVCGAERITYAELADRVARLGQGLAARGIRPGDPVALVMRDGPAFVASFFAATGLGAVVVPMNPQFKQAELSYCFGECGVRAVICDTDKASTCRAIVSGWAEPVDVITADRDGLEGLIEDHPPLPFAPVDPDDDAVFQYSAGATGGPKRVPRTQRQLRDEADSLVATIGISSADVLLSTIPLFHSYGMGTCMLAAVRGAATLVILEEAHPFLLRRDHALEVLEGEGVTIFPAVPFIIRLLAEAPGTADLSALRLCFSAANALPRQTFDAFGRKFGIPVRQLYGCTEAGAVTANLDEDPWGTPGSVGRPLEGVEIEIVDHEGNPVERDRIGEIAIRSPALTRGYAGLEELNRRAFRDGYFLTGDRGRLDHDGRLYITGRAKLLIDVKGDKVDPIEVEDVLAVHPRVREVVVVGVDSAEEGEDIVKAVVVPDGECEVRELIRFARERLANYNAPQMVEFRDEIPRSPSGEVLRKYLV